MDSYFFGDPLSSLLPLLLPAKPLAPGVFGWGEIHGPLPCGTAKLPWADVDPDSDVVSELCGGCCVWDRNDVQAAAFDEHGKDIGRAGPLQAPDVEQYRPASNEYPPERRDRRL
jgi:hypothetical protein